MHQSVEDSTFEAHFSDEDVSKNSLKLIYSEIELKIFRVLETVLGRVKFENDENDCQLGERNFSGEAFSAFDYSSLSGRIVSFL